MRSEYEHRRESLIKTIDDSSLSDQIKLLYRQIADKAAEGTNGLSKEDKLQNVSETCFSLTELNITRDCNSKKEYDLMNSKLDEIANRLEKNDIITNEIKEKERLAEEDTKKQLQEISEKLDNTTVYLDKADKIIEAFKVNETKEHLNKKYDSKLVLVTDLFKKIGWPGAFTIVGTVIVIALRPEIIAALKKLFM